MRTAIGSDTAIGLLRETLMRGVLDACSSGNALGAEQALIQLVSLGAGRYLARLPALASAGIETIAEEVGPVLDRYLSRSARLAAWPG